MGALVRAIRERHTNPSILTRTHYEVDPTDQQAVRNFFKNAKPDKIYLAAAKVEGIHAHNIFPADFIYENLMTQASVDGYAFRNGVRKLLFLSSSRMSSIVPVHPIHCYYT